MIKELTYEEAARLRDLIRCRFIQSPFNGAGIKLSQYKDSYRHLAEDIVRVVPDANSSVTTNRLRKFFYYTNPEVCAPDKLEKPSFGDDFIQVLFKYLEEEQEPVPPPPPPIPRKWLRLTVALLLLLVIALVVWQWLNRPEYWQEHFDNVSVEGLKSRGWEILDYDSTAFVKQSRPGYLTLPASRGDYWFTPPDTPIITNLMLRKINSESAKITLKLTDFNPVQDFQQAGIFLLDKHKNPSHFMRVTFVGNNTSIPPRQIIQMLKMVHGTAYEKKFPFRQWSPDVPPTVSLPIWIQVQFAKGRFRFFFHDFAENASFIECGEIDFNFKPHYVAIGAFRGQRHIDGSLNNSEAIPAFFDYLKVEPIPE